MTTGSAGIWTIVLTAGERPAPGSLAPDQRRTAASLRSTASTWETAPLADSLARGGPLTTIVAPVHGRTRIQLPAQSVVEEPAGRGTAPGVLLALQRVLATDPEAALLILPSAPHVAREDVLREGIAEALEAVRRSPSKAVLLGIEPESSEPGRSWVVPTTNQTLTGVSSFVENPDAATSHRLHTRGALWNSFILAARASTLLELFARSVPALVNRLVSVRVPTEGPRDRLRLFYPERVSTDFFRHVLAPCARLLRLLRIGPCGATDLGTTDRDPVGSHKAVFPTRADVRGSARWPAVGVFGVGASEPQGQQRRAFRRRSARTTRRRRPRLRS